MFLLALVGVFNAADRQILSILAEAVKKDLRIGDAQLAFLYGTAFVTLYTLLGLAVARLADRMARTRLLAGGLAIWSAMTVFGGFAPNFALLAAARVGVGIGEATANPVGHSLICDYFPRRNRGMALGINLAGIFVGSGVAAMLGGFVLDAWPRGCGGLGLCSIRPWQAAFLIVGAPGLVLAAFVALLHEPVRGALDGHPIVPPRTGHWPAFGSDLASVVPMVSSWILLRDCGPRVALRNAALSAAILGAAVALALLTGDTAQWIALSIAVCAIAGWSVRTAVIDPPLIHLTFGTPAFTLAVGGFAIMGCIMGAAQFWMVPYAIRTFGVSATVAGSVLGPAIGLSAIVGVIGGGLVSDRWRERDERGYIWTAMTALVSLSAALVVMLHVPTFKTYAVALFAFNALSISWSAAAAAQVQDLVIARMRGTTAAIAALCVTLVTMAAGPYLAGKLGVVAGSLAIGLQCLLLLVPLAIGCFVMAARCLPTALATKLARAAALGEPTEDGIPDPARSPG